MKTFLIGCLLSLALGAPAPQECTINSDCGEEFYCDRFKRQCLSVCPEFCGDNTRCRFDNHNPICVCLPGYKGDPDVGCTLLQIPSSPCVPSPCGEGAKCRVENGLPSCSCPAGKTGDPYLQCTQDGQMCSWPQCGPNSGCRMVGGRPVCSCIPGYQGGPPEVPCVKTVEMCGTNPCGPNTECEVFNNRKCCSCQSGYQRGIRGCVRSEHGSFLPRHPPFHRLLGHNFFRNFGQYPRIPHPFHTFNDYDTFPNKDYDTSPNKDYDNFHTHDHDTSSTHNYDLFPSRSPFDVFTSILSSLFGSEKETRCGALCQILNQLAVIKSKEDEAIKSFVEDEYDHHNATYYEKVRPDGSVLRINRTTIHNKDDDGNGFVFHSSVHQIVQEKEDEEEVTNKDPEEDDLEEKEGSGDVDKEKDISEDKDTEASSEFEEEEVSSTTASVEENKEFTTPYFVGDEDVENDNEAGGDKEEKGSGDSEQDKPDEKEGSVDVDGERDLDENIDEKASSEVGEGMKAVTEYSNEVFVGETKTNTEGVASDMFDLRGIGVDVNVPTIEELGIVDLLMPR